MQLHFVMFWYVAFSNLGLWNNKDDNEDEDDRLWNNKDDNEDEDDRLWNNKDDNEDEDD